MKFIALIGQIEQSVVVPGYPEQSVEHFLMTLHIPNVILLLKIVAIGPFSIRTIAASISHLGHMNA